ncbi:MAG: LacI family DNA-binding transcriptional regulator [Candidatus Marinimicrobia bacterium]|nr:LacI family DNA-binding transcriptional regulator [Candidatus Neomarinimicrobiota bacterium]
MKRNPTLKDLAKELNLSVSTVSRALQNHPAISKSTIERAQKLAAEVGYFPNVVAKSLKIKSTRTIGVIVPEIRHFFFSSAIDGIEDVTYKEGYTIMVAKSNEDLEREVLNTVGLISNRVAGVIASISQTTKQGLHFQRIIARGIPLVFFDRILDDLKVPKVVSNDFDSAYKTVNHLIESGYRRIAHLAGPVHLNISQKRLDGYKQALTDNGLEINEEMIICCHLSEESGARGAQTLLALSPRPEAICCVNDPVAVGVYQQLRKVGLKIPDDVGVTGFSNNPITAMLSPAMTTIDQHGYEMGRTAAKILLEEINNERAVTTDQTYLIDGELIIRESSQLNLGG